MDILRKQFAAIVDQQLRDDQPAFVRATLDRLQAAGYSEERGKDLIATCVAEEMMEMILTDAPFNEERYQQLLDQLPNLPR